ncbi:MAG: glycosyltransferase family 2 protein [Opitutales bacterium]|nr:glycosyltransferase family 2 protein [Opitutales bacterium]
MTTSVIISTYNNPKWLERVVWGYQCQSCLDFEMVIADDGSREDTAALVRHLAANSPFPIRHVWHADEGFRKCAILNKAISSAEGDYLLISDGDCIPRKDFVQVHMDLRKKGHFISGGYCKLPMETSLAITREDIEEQRPFDPAWLRNNGCPQVPLKLRARGGMAKLLNKLTTTLPSWNGHNSSAWKEDILSVNGFNEDMSYGGLDRELGERMVNKGVIPIQARHLAICVHLDHSRGYVKKELVEQNIALRRKTRSNGIAWAANGIVKSVKN